MDYHRCDDSNAGFEIEAGKIQKLIALAITWNVLLNNRFTVAVHIPA